MSVMRDYMNIYRCMAVMLLAIQAQSNFLYGMLRNKSAVIPGSSVLPLTVIPQKFEKALKQAKEDLDAVDDEGRTMLHKAVISNGLQAVERLLGNGANANATDNFGRTPIYWAVFQGDLDVVQMLIDYGANINFADGVDKQTPLHITAQEGNISLTQILLDNGANANATDNRGITPVHWAAGYGNIDLVKMLIGNGANINATDNNGKTPLHLAAASGNIEVVQFLINAGADLNAIDTTQQTPHDRVLLRLAEEDIVAQESRLSGMEDENQRIEIMQEIAHNQAKATKRERLEVCLYMLEHPDQINSILPKNPTKSARNR